jgi:hypothetical protein
MAAPLVITCRFCAGTNCEHGDDCRDCGCPECGFPGARIEGRGFCPEPCCDWEAVPGAYRAWKARQPVYTVHQMWRAVRAAWGVELPPDDEVGGALFTLPE